MRPITAAVVIVGVVGVVAWAYQAPDTESSGTPFVAAFQGVDTDSNNQVNRPQDDITITSCGSSSSYFTKAGGMVTNHSSKRSDYRIEVKFVNGAGVQMDTGYDFVNSVDAGGSATWEAMLNVDEDTWGQCKLVTVNRTAS